MTAKKPLPEPFASMQRFITETTEAAERGEVQLTIPIRDYHCANCGNHFDARSDWPESDIICPSCNSKGLFFPPAPVPAVPREDDTSKGRPSDADFEFAHRVLTQRAVEYEQAEMQPWADGLRRVAAFIASPTRSGRAPSVGGAD